MNAFVRRSVAALFAAVLLNSTLAGPTPTPKGEASDQGTVKVCVKIEAPGTISEAVENQIVGQFKNLNNVSLVDDPDDADHILNFEIHELTTQSDKVLGYAIVVIWTWRQGVRDIEKYYVDRSGQDARDSFEQFVSGMSFYLADEFYVCDKAGLKQRLASIISRFDAKVFQRRGK